MSSSYDELPRLADVGLPCAWTVFGDGDDLGTINRLTPDRVVDGATSVQEGTVVSLALPSTEPDPPLFGRERMRQTVIHLDRNTLDERFDGFFPQASTHWDGLRHVRAREYGYYGGVQEFGPAGAALSIDRWGEAGIVGRGVLIDLERFLRNGTHPIEPLRVRHVSIDLVAACLRAQGIDLRRGDVICLRFGWTQAYRKLDASGRAAYASEPTFAGLASGDGTARFLWDAGVAAVASDNPAVEASQVQDGDFLHRRLVPLLGFALGELFDFERLAGLCAADGRYDFFFVSAPLRIDGGIASPANAVAIR
jgi:kynurenine formamidase